jgi:hypothetical protein
MLQHYAEPAHGSWGEGNRRRSVTDRASGLGVDGIEAPPSSFDLDFNIQIAGKLGGALGSVVDETHADRYEIARRAEVDIDPIACGTTCACCPSIGWFGVVPDIAVVDGPKRFPRSRRRRGAR